MEFVHISQKCVKRTGLITATATDPDFYLEWTDQGWANEQKTFLNCDCGNELTASGSFISDDENGVKYKCTDCGKTSVWNFDLFPVPVNIKLFIKEFDYFLTMISASNFLALRSLTLILFIGSSSCCAISL